MMKLKLPVIHGVIRRRLLINYRADPEVVQKLLPGLFRPKLHAGFAIVGICLIRLENIRPSRIPRRMGINSENAAHRIAVQWDDENGETRDGVYIPRRDTSSRLNHYAGGRFFPGEHHLSNFEIIEDSEGVHFSMKGSDGFMEIRVDGYDGEESAFPQSSCFDSLTQASTFFESGSDGYSVSSDPGRLDGIRLDVQNWQVKPLLVTHLASSFYDDVSKFPKGSITFDHALVMRDIAHRWLSLEDIHTCCPQ